MIRSVPCVWCLLPHQSSMTSVLGRRDKAQSTGYNACMLKTCRKRQGHCTRNLLANREKVHELREQPSLLVIQSTSWFPCNSHPCLPSSLMDKFGLYFSFFFQLRTFPVTGVTRGESWLPFSHYKCLHLSIPPSDKTHHKTRNKHPSLVWMPTILQRIIMDLCWC